MGSTIVTPIRGESRNMTEIGESPKLKLALTTRKDSGPIVNRNYQRTFT